jgi:2-amino-4-hydroxy-6-hydroxymethyldihydropteridine diphosphokinase
LSSSVRVAVALGSNLGDREAHVDFALARLALLLTDLTASSRYETAPVGVQGPQPPFLNAVATGRSSLSAHDLLRALQQIEADRGRERPYANAPRTLDLDLIFFGDVVSADPHLTLPHPRFRERRFVLEPLAEIAPDLVDPVTGKTVRRLLEEAGE